MPTLPKNTRVRPLVRVLYRNWSTSSTGTGQWSAWQPLPMSQRLGSRTATNGFLVDMWSRHCLPMIGEARLRYRSGRINGIDYYGTDVLGNPIPVDLSLAEIRIQVAPAPPFEAPRETIKNFTPAWTTAWMGTVEQIQTMGTTGETVFHCFDGFYRAKRWQMVSHHMYFNAQQYKGRGHPGYNVGVDGFYCRVQGNKEPTNVIDDPMGDIASSGITNRNYAFTWPALGDNSVVAVKWTDKQAVESACQGSRGRGEPVLEMRGQTDLLASASAWPVVEGMKCWDFVAQVCDRRRGRGLTFFDWEDDSAAPDGPLNVCLRIRSPFISDVIFTPPGTVTPITLPGASGAGTTMALDYSDDHRLVPGSVVVGDRLAYRMDYVESAGEYLEVLTTLSGADGSLQGRYADADATAFLAVANPRWRSTARWDPVYQRFGIPTNWQWLAKNGSNTGTASRCDYSCGDDGDIIDPVPGSSAYPFASPLLAQILSDLPLYEGYDYRTDTPVRYDASKDPTAPPRRPIMGFVQTNGDNFLDLTRIGGFSLQVDPQFGVYVKFSENQSEFNAGRFFSVSGVPGFAYNWQQLVLTVGLRLGNRVRMADGDPLSPRRLFIKHPGLHLWLAHPGAIWELDRTASVVAEAPALRNAADGIIHFPGILRDDRPALASLHELATIWYLQDHRTASLALRDCVFLPSYTDEDDVVYTYPQLGTLVTSLSYTDATRETQSPTLDTPVTGLIFDNVKCRSDISTDWSDLDFVSR